MPRAKCRCGQSLRVPRDGSERIVCPQCGARVRVVLREGGASAPRPEDENDGFLRFPCPCGRRLKVLSNPRPTHGKCPDCGRVVPVPRVAARRRSAAETPTAELSFEDAANLNRWAESHRARRAQGERPEAIDTPPSMIAGPPPVAVAQPFRAEAGLRVCPSCGKPVHMGADACRACGTPVPKR